MNRDQLILERFYELIYEKDTQYTADRIPYRSERAYSGRGGKKLKVATAVAYRSHQAIPKDQAKEFAHFKDPKQRRIGRNLISNAVRPIEEKYLRQWAKAQNLMLDNADFEKKWQEQGQMGEAENNAYFDEASQRWFKRNNLSYHSNWLEFFYRLALQTELFPEAAYALEGFVETVDGLQPVISQPHVRGERGASRQEVIQHMKKLGYQNLPGTDDYYNKLSGIKVEDMHDENVLIGPDGMMYVIDPVIYLDDEGKIGRITSQEPLEWELAA